MNYIEELIEEEEDAEEIAYIEAHRDDLVEFKSVARKHCSVAGGDKNSHNLSDYVPCGQSTFSVAA